MLHASPATRLRRSALALVPFALALLVSTARAQDGPEEPSDDDPWRPVQTEFPVEHAFERPLLPPRGYASLQDMRGKPVVFVYWWMESVEAAERIAETLAWLEPARAEIEVVFCEASEASDLAVERYLWNKGLMGSFASFTREPAVPRKVWQPFHLFLLDESGRVASWGPLYGRDEERAAALEELIEAAQIPADATDKKIRKAWTAFRAGKWKSAQSQAEKARAVGLKRIEKGDAAPYGELDLYNQAGFVLLAIEAETKRYADRGLHLLDLGYPLEAEALLGELADRDPPSTPACSLQMQRLEQPFKEMSMRKYRKRAKVLAEIVRGATGDPSTGGDLRSYREPLLTFLDGPDDLLAARARHLLELIEP